jgi:lysozyme family protein
MSGFMTALHYVFGEEGGLADVAADRGGRTNLGIATPTWNEWRDRLGKPGQPVDDCTREDAETIYHTGYWLGAKCDGLPWPVSLVVFDSAVQHGPRNAVKLLQRAVGVKDDGAVGPDTLAAAAKVNTAKLVRALLFARLSFYRGILVNDKSQREFAAGWIARVLNLRARCVRDMPEVA